MTDTSLLPTEPRSAATEQHTPGPWFPIWNDHYWEINIADYRYAFTIGTVWAREAGVPASAVADARLIAAAPDMLAALKEISRNAALSDAWLDPVRAAIAKAEGRQP